MRSHIVPAVVCGISARATGPFLLVVKIATPAASATLPPCGRE